MRTNKNSTQIKTSGYDRPNLVSLLRIMDPHRNPTQHGGIVSDPVISLVNRYRRESPKYIQYLHDKGISMAPLKVAVLINEGLAIKPSARMLNLSERTVGHHRCLIRVKLGLSMQDDLETALSSLLAQHR